MKFLIDKEVNLNTDDLLKTSSYSKALYEVINSAPTDAAFTIGLFGEWGSGKSSIVKTVGEEFSTTKKIKFVVYDAWKYSNDSFRRMFLLKLQQDLGFERTEKFDSFYRNKTSDVSVKRKVDWKYIILTAIILIIGITLVNLIPKGEENTKITLALVVTFLGILVNILGRAFSDYKVTVQEPMIFAPEQFEECFNEMIPKVFQRNNTIDKLAKWINGQNYISGLDKLVIVIDNIDRCPKDKAYEMITNVKSFLSTQKKVIFLIPVDDEALKRHIIKEENNDVKEAEEFLRKFFSVTIRIKPFKRFDLYDFTNNLNKAYNLNFNPTTIDIVSKEYATNPRRIIQFFNDLMSELKIFEINQGTDFNKTHESLICKMLILRQEWPDYYKMISKNSNLILDTDSIRDYLKSNPELNSFLNVTESITRNETIKVIETILSTFDRETKIPNEVILLVEKKEFNEIEKLVKEDRQNISTLVDYLIERLNLGILRKTFKTDVNNTFETLCYLDSKFQLTPDQNIRISAEVRQHVKEFFRAISDANLLITYGHKIKSQGLPYIDSFLRDFMDVAINDKGDENTYPYVKGFFRTYIKNESSKGILKQLSPLFEIEFNRSASHLQDYELESDQLNEIVNENVLTTIIGRTATLDSENETFKELIYTSTKIKMTSKSFREAIARLDTMVPAFTNFSKEQITQYIKVINLFLINQQTVSINEDDIETLNGLKNKLLANRNVSNRPVNIHTESLDSEQVSIIVNFLKYVYVCSKGKVEVLSNLNSLLATSPNERREIINEKLLEIKRERPEFHLTTIQEVIINDETYTDKTIELNEFILTNKESDGKYLLDENLASQKLERFVDFFANNKVDNIYKFLERIINDERAKGLLAKIVTKLSKSNILELPKNLQVLSFDKVCEGDTIFDYQENIDFLKAIASEGEKKHISQLVKVIVSKLQRQDKVHEGFEILDEVRELKGQEKKTIESIVEGMKDGDEQEKALKKLKKL
jgi:hypothetical protein